MSSKKRSDFIHVGLSVSDLERTIAWYEKHFGCTCTKRFEKQELEIKGAVMELGTAIFEVLQPYKPEKKEISTRPLLEELRNLGTNHIAIAVDNIAECYETFRGEGCDMVTQLLDGRMFFCKDPDGVLIEVKAV